MPRTEPILIASTSGERPALLTRVEAIAVCGVGVWLGLVALVAVAVRY